MKHLKLLFIIGILVLSIIVIGCSSNKTNEIPMPPEKSQISQNTAPTAASDEQDIQTSNDDFSQIDSALGSY